MSTSTVSSATQSNVQVIQQSIQNFLKKDIAGILKNCTDDIVWSTFRVPNSPYSGTLHGKEAVQEYFKFLNEKVTFTNWEAREYIGQGDRVIVLGTSAGTVKDNGNPFGSEFCLSFRLRDGKVSEYFGYYDSYQENRSLQS